MQPVESIGAALEPLNITPDENSCQDLLRSTFRWKSALLRPCPPLNEFEFFARSVIASEREAQYRERCVTARS